jgi:hypothetical protein
MGRVLRFALVIALLPAVAAADALDDSLAPYSLSESERSLIRALSFADFEHSLELEAHASVSGLAGRLTGGQATAGGEIAWNAGPCRALVGGGEATADKTSEVTQLSGSFWGGFCLPFPMNRFEMIVKSDYALQPSLAALPVAQRARYTGITVDFRNTFIGWKTKTREHAVIPFALTFGTFEQPDLDIGKVGASIAAYRRTDVSGRMVEILPAAMRAAGPANFAAASGLYLSAEASEISPFRLVKTSPGSLGPFTLEADFVAGLGHANISRPPAGGMQMAPVLYRDYDLFVDTTIRAIHGEDTVALQLRRAFEPTFTDEVLLDTRADLSWYRNHGKHAVLLGAFAAVTRRMDRAGPVDSTPSGGLRGIYNYTLPGHMKLALSGEVARSFYATLDDTLALDAAWSAQLNASFSFAFTRKPAAATP